MLFRSSLSIQTNIAYPSQIACNAAEVSQQFAFGGSNTWAGGTLTKSFVVGSAPNNVTVTFTNTQSAPTIAGDPSLQTLGNIASSLRISFAAFASSHLPL